MMPMVFGGRPPNISDDDVYVDVDNLEGGMTATERLLAIGRRRVGTITGPLDMPAAVDRLDGFRRAMATARLPDDAVEIADFSVAGAVARPGACSTGCPTSTASSSRATSWRPARSRCCASAAAACPRTSPSSATTTAPPRPRPRSRSRPCTSRRRTWAT